MASTFRSTDSLSRTDDKTKSTDYYGAEREITFPFGIAPKVFVTTPPLHFSSSSPRPKVISSFNRIKITMVKTGSTPNPTSKQSNSKKRKKINLFYGTQSTIQGHAYEVLHCNYNGEKKLDLVITFDWRVLLT